MEEKKCPVDRGKVLIALECCREFECPNCPYPRYSEESCKRSISDALAYINYLEERLGVTG